MESISKYSKLHDEHSFIIYSSNRALILADNRFERHKQAIIDQIESGKKSMKIKGEKYMILNTALNTQELYVLSIIPYSGVYGDLTRYSVGMIILSFFILLCGILISVITARKIYFPFDAMYRSLFKEEDSITDNNEIEQIKLLFGEYSKKIDMYGTESEKNKRIIEEYSINKLLKNSNELSSKDIEKIFSLISLSIEQDFAVVVLSIDEIDGETNYIDNIINYALYNISLETLPEIYGEVCDKLNYRFMNEENKNIYENKQMRTVYEIKKYIEENYHRNTACIAELSDRMKISQKRLRETFKKSENISFAAYLTKFRIEKAKEYILTTDLNFSKISEKIGISNDTYFYKLFKDECGMTPSEFKKYGMARKKETEN